jgi:hypothetical protein
MFIIVFPVTYLTQNRCSVVVERNNTGVYGTVRQNTTWQNHLCCSDHLQWLTEKSIPTVFIRKTSNTQWLNSLFDYFVSLRIEVSVLRFILFWLVFQLAICFYKIITYLRAEAVQIVSFFAQCKAQWTDIVSLIHISELNCPEFFQTCGKMEYVLLLM